jgi:hypothetical protein
MRKGMANTGLAGPAANILLALVTLSLYKISFRDRICTGARLVQGAAGAHQHFFPL